MSWEYFVPYLINATNVTSVENSVGSSNICYASFCNSNFCFLPHLSAVLYYIESYFEDEA
jgi:hypothetical protein